MKSKILEFIEKKTDVTPQEDGTRQNVWRSWYDGTNDWYNYRVLLANLHKEQRRKLSLNMPAKVCQDWAALLMNEKTEITLSDEADDNILWEELDKNNFIPRFQEQLERSFGIGSGAVVVGHDKDKNPTLSFVDGTRIAVLSSSAGQVTEAAFYTESKKGNNTYYVVSIHKKDLIKNYVLDKDFKELQADQALKEFNIIASETIKVKRFTFLKPARSRIDDWTTPFGQSIFASGIDACKLIDTAYDSFVNEFVLGKKRIFVATSALEFVTVGGKKQAIFDSNEVVFSVLPEMGDGEKTLIKEIDMKLRSAEHLEAIQTGLNLLSAQCGLGNSYYSFDKTGSAITATQVISESSELFRNIKKQENAIEQNIKDIVVAVMDIKGKEIDREKIMVKFDDSILVDDETERNNMRQDVQDGITPKWQYRMRFYGETEEEAKKAVSEVEPIVDLNNLGIE